MNEEQVIDIFDSLGDTNFENVDTSYPVLKAGAYNFTVKDMKREVWKSGQGSSIHIDLELQDETTDVSGERVIAPGYVLTDRISLVAKGKYDPKQAVARFLESIGMKNQPFDTEFHSYIGASLVVKVKIDPESTDAAGNVWPAKSVVGTYVKA